ncbi:MAG: glutathione-disulfide reductase [Hyphomicrobiaceae bacterium]
MSGKSEYEYDLFVIGAGSGGVRAARIAAGHGARVAVAEEYRVGGTCVIRGCVPKKLLVYASRFADEFEDAKGFGWSVENAAFDWSALIAAKDKEIARLEAAYRSNLDKAGVTLFETRATLSGPNSVLLEKPGREITAQRILIATGGWPQLVSGVDGIEHAITSNEAFHLPRLPRRIVINGGGYIALEFAGIFHGLGSETTVVYRGDKILRGFDEDLRDALSEELLARGIRIVTGTTFKRIEKTAGGLRSHMSDGSVLESDQVMFATGRTPNVKGLGLETAGVELDDNGGVKVDRKSQTSVPGIYAVGDVTHKLNLTPVAIREGHAFADSTFGPDGWSTDYDMVPTAVFSTPEIGTVGLTEGQARDPDWIAANMPALAGLGGQIDLYKARFRPMKGTLSGRSERMLMKLIVDKQSDRVLGCHILGPDAAEIVQMVAIAMRMGATKADFDRTMALHPSAAEEIVTMRTKWSPPKSGS